MISHLILLHLCVLAVCSSRSGFSQTVKKQKKTNLGSAYIVRLHLFEILVFSFSGNKVMGYYLKASSHLVSRSAFAFSKLTEAMITNFKRKDYVLYSFFQSTSTLP